MDIRHLQYFVKAAECRSFSKAAQSLYITQQGMSKAIAKLEEELGIPLFIRSHNTLTLTHAGETVLAHAQEILRQSNSMLSALADFKSDAAGRLRIAYAEGIFSTLPADFLSSFLKAHPMIDISIRKCNDYESETLLVSGESDLAFCTEPYDEQRLQPLIRTQAPIHAVLGAQHPLAQNDVLHMRDLSGERLVSLNMETKHHNPFNHALAAFGLHPQVYINPQESDIQFSLAQAGIAIGFYSGNPGNVPAGVVLRPITDMPICSRYVLLCRKDAHVTSAMRLFAAALEDALQPIRRETFP